MSSTYHAFELVRCIASEIIPNLHSNTHGVEILARALEKIPRDSDVCRGFASELLPYLESGLWSLHHDDDAKGGIPFP